MLSATENALMSVHRPCQQPKEPHFQALDEDLTVSHHSNQHTHSSESVCKCANAAAREKLVCNFARKRKQEASWFATPLGSWCAAPMLISNSAGTVTASTAAAAAAATAAATAAAAAAATAATVIAAATAATRQRRIATNNNQTMIIVVWTTPIEPVDCPTLQADISFTFMLNPAEVTQRINQRVESLCFRSSDDLDSHRPHVCLVCDEILKPKEVKLLTLKTLRKASDILKPSQWNQVSSDLAECCRCQGDLGNRETDVDWVQDLLLSPRGCFIRANDARKNDGFAVCSNCKSCLSRKKLSLFAIANNCCVGSPPACLVELTEIELACITPVKSHGHCFSHTGGAHKKLKGSLSCCKVDTGGTVRSALQLDVLGLRQNIVVILHGKMTPRQREMAKKKNKLRVDKVLRALEWLLVHNEEWKQVEMDLNEVRNSLKNPVVVDASTADNGQESDNNVETTESFRVFFPDGTMSSLNGGQEKIEEFRELLKAATESGCNLEFQCDLARESVRDFADNNLVNACLLQFPHGRGGMHERRELADGTLSTSVDVESCVEHLSKLSQPHLHRELFSLILCNLTMKQAMLRTACWRVRSKNNAKDFAQELTADDVSNAINQRESGGLSTNSTGGRFLSAIDAVTGSVAHTNEAAKRARRDGEALQHHFGMASVFLTVSPDDNNSWVVQLLAGVKTDDGEDVSQMTDEELEQRAKARTDLRIGFPGLCAFCCELVLEIVIEEVIGWDLENHCPREEGGLLGIPEAFSGAGEEQGRGSLHTHFQIWLREFCQMRDRLHSGNNPERISAQKDICDFVDRMSSCKLIDKHKCGSGNHISFVKAFDHKCTVPVRKRKLPQVVEDQELRNLRHQQGATQN